MEASDSPRPAAPADAPLAVAVSLDFASKQVTVVAPAAVRGEMAAGRFVWIDVDIAREAEARALLAELALCDGTITEDAAVRARARRRGAWRSVPADASAR
jgi:hypothetical protein